MSKQFDNKIKSLKPKRNSHYHQGYVSEKLCTKLFRSAKNEPIIYRSQLELQFIQFCENNPKIKQWASEPIGIEYFSRIFILNKRYFSLKSIIQFFGFFHKSINPYCHA